MASPAVEKPMPVTGESRSARKKKAKAEAAAPNGSISTVPALPEHSSQDNSTMADADSSEHPYLKELQKQIRNINKKLTAMQKLDSILAENPGVALNDLVAQRKINQDQKAAALKKPHLQAQLIELEERQEHYRKFESDYQVKFTKQKADLTTVHQQELDKVKEEARVEANRASAADLRNKLLIFSQFLRAAAAKRTIAEEADSDESVAFEGALLLVYGGDQKAVETARSIIEGTPEHVPSIEGIPTSVSYAQVKQASMDHAPFQTEEAWVDQVAEATGENAAQHPVEMAGASSDPTIANAGLTELEAPSQRNSTDPNLELSSALPASAGDAGNLASERWDTAAAGAGAEKSGLEDSYEMIPRPSDEVDVPADHPPSAAQQPQSTSWADEPTVYEAGAGTSNQAGEAWHTKAPGEQTDNSWAAETKSANGWAEPPAQDASSAPADDGFHEVPGRQRGRGGRGRGGDGELRGRGGGRRGFRGRGNLADGDFRGRGGYRGGRGDGAEYRGGRGRGRGARGGAGADAGPSS